MKTVWDYTNLAQAYLHRPDYASEAIDKLLDIAQIKAGDKVCDVGAGAAHLTLELAKRDLQVCAIEPNDAMRANGQERTKEFKNVQWFEGVGEDTKMESNAFSLVTFGSSFNVCDRLLALKESSRILKSHGYFACMWNHRDLDDPLQKAIEDIIKSNIKDYDYGSRREDQTKVIESSNLFDNVGYLEGHVVHKVAVDSFIEGWKSHGTLYRQSPELFNSIINQISALIHKSYQDTVDVPYTTRVYFARKKD